MSRLPIRLAAGIAAIALTVAACSSDDSTSDATEAPEQTSSTTAAPAEPSMNIVEIASGEEDFSTLVTAVTTADLAETLSGEGPFTVFAPTNAAFAEIPEDQLNAILADQEQLTAILTYHVVPGKVMAGDLQPSQQVETVQGDTVDIQVGDAGATINGCNIVTTDIEASNGVIHVIDCVLLPPAA
jgi:uncharacterized surface protein with fasciclin (FAS1) repeats